MKNVLSNIVLCLIIIINISHVFSLPVYEGVHPKENVAPEKVSDDSERKKTISKRIASNGIRLSKLFEAKTSDTNPVYVARLSMEFTDFNYLNKNYTLEDDVSHLTINPASYSRPINRYENHKLTYQYSQLASIADTFSASYEFTLQNPNGRKTLYFQLFDSDRNLLLSETQCVDTGSFNDNSTPGAVAFILLGIAICVVIIIILWCWSCCFGGFSKQPSSNTSRITIMNYFNKNPNLMTNSTKTTIESNQHSSYSQLINLLKEENYQDLEMGLLGLDMSTSRSLDAHLIDIFRKINEAFLNIWRNQMSKEYPRLENRFVDLLKMVRSEEERLHANYANDKMKALAQRSQQIKKYNEEQLKNLLSQQSTERRDKMNLANVENQDQVSQLLDKIFEKEVKDLNKMLLLKQEKEIEELRHHHYINLIQNLKSTQLRMVNDYLERMPTELNLEERNQIISEFIKMQSEFQKFKESEKIREIGKLEEIDEIRQNIVVTKAQLSTDFEERVDRRDQLIQKKFIELEENYELDPKLFDNIVNEYKAYKLELMSKMKEDRQKQLDFMKTQLGQRRTEKLQVMENEHSNEVFNLITHSNTEDNLEIFTQELSQLIVKHHQRFADAQCQMDEDESQDVMELYKESYKETENKLDEKMTILVSGLSNRVDPEDLNDIMNSYHGRLTKLEKEQKSNREKQEKLLFEKLKAKKEEIFNNVGDQIVKQNMILNMEKEIIEDIVDRQKALSNKDRTNIFQEFGKNQSALESSLTLTHLEQKQRMEQLLMSKKGESIEQINKDYQTKAEKFAEKRLQKDSQMSEEELLNFQRSKDLMNLLEAKLSIMVSESWKEGLEDELQNIRKEILSLRNQEIERKEEETAAFLNMIQITKSKQQVEFEDDQQKYNKLLMAVVELSKDKDSSKKILDSFIQSKDKLNDKINSDRIFQNEKLKRSLKRKATATKLHQVDGAPQNESLALIQCQNTEEEKLVAEMENQKELEKQKMVAIREILASGQVTKEELEDFLPEAFPNYTNDDIQRIITEFAVKTQKTVDQANFKTKSSFKDAYIKFTELHKSAEDKPNSLYEVAKAVKLQKKSNSFVSSESQAQPISNFDEVDTVDSGISRKKKKKKRRTNPSEDQQINEDEDEF